MAYNLILQRC